MKNAKQLRIPTVKITDNTKVNVVPRGTGRKIQQKKHDYEMEVNPEGNEIHNVMIRFGTSIGRDKYEWGTTMAIAPVKIDKQYKIVAKVDADQIPSDAKYFQILCEIVDKNNRRPKDKSEAVHTETLLLAATPLKQARKHQ